MNFGVIVLLVVVVWCAVSIVVALAVGGMAKARDAGAAPLLDHNLAAGRVAPAARDEGVRAVV